MSGPSTEDKALDIGWNILTGIPGVGSMVAGGKAIGYDLPGVFSDDKEQSQQSLRDLASDGLSAVPLIGTITSFAGGCVCPAMLASASRMRRARLKTGTITATTGVDMPAVYKRPLRSRRRQLAAP